MTQKIFIVMLVTLSFLVGRLTASKTELLQPDISTENQKPTTFCDDMISTLDISVSETYEGEVAQVNFDSYPEAELFKTSISSQVSSGVNYAGHYTVATWGCGTNCEGYAVVDVISGEIIEYVGSLEREYINGIDFNSNSSLLVINPRYTGEQLDRIKSKSTQELLEDEFKAGDTRIYYQLISSGNTPYLSKICEENFFDGQI